MSDLEVSIEAGALWLTFNRPEQFNAMTEAMVLVSRRPDSPDPQALIELLTEFTIGGISRILRRKPEVIERLR